ncbi:MAG: 4-hydroxy-3-methylbut-2-enyl diphosphate reductase [Holosporales bacterium]|jgi:4-hydroxy-3-methylbut-2-enyl diphosphate reductase|nr:4-hydroxy-3-methylbut-2-enyl diphosphate reductase [Holosporales bacterium]
MSITCYLLSPRGFCSGVSRAVNMAEQIVKLYGTVYVVEDIIHNKTFMNSMVKKGIVKVPSIDDVPNGAAVMFSAHGTPPQVLEKAEKRELTIVDSTCPVVKAIQNEIAKEAEAGKKIVIIGNRAHAEILAFLGSASETDVFVVYSEIDVDLLDDFTGNEVVYFTQTTLDHVHVQSIVNRLKEKVPHIKSNSQNNICYATKERQDVVRHIAGSTDLMIIVGSSHSSNAKRLREVALDSGAKNVVLIDSKNELEDSVFNGVETAAITAAASTPEEVVQELVCYLEDKLGIIFSDFKLPNEDGE